MNAPRSPKLAGARYNSTRPTRRSSQLSFEVDSDSHYDLGATGDSTTSRPSMHAGKSSAETSTPGPDFASSRDAVLQRAISSSSRRSRFLHPPAYDTQDDDARLHLPPLEHARQTIGTNIDHSTLHLDPARRHSTTSTRIRLPFDFCFVFPQETTFYGYPVRIFTSILHYTVYLIFQTCRSPELGSAIIEPLRKVRVSSGRLSDRQIPEDIAMNANDETKGATKGVVYSRGHINYILNSTDDTAGPSIGAGLSQSVPSSVPSKPRASPPAAENWEIYARQVKRSDGSLAYQCLWTTKDNDASVPCLYTSKKQLVKRHVETTHLKVKRFICEICNKAFPQKTSLDIHKHGHTGDTPHACIYNCGKAFKDPARRHRHHIEAHGYVPKQFKRKYKASVPNQEQSEYESLEPWRPLDS
ncbi:hypothetical protein PLEOSDRAFT_1082885 [Pleurotus ostreatus PC15]|uniref:C2H2-type domain-containing protein n=1 Tax=Pleurotus ostreatus (strain PC15) TaxID=1137138 RepID=A0A067NZC6_PLEO1|nr:hypothetical protein PLEOSDRAFT_1082885 [Pleurotus ostreatus PC15]